MRGELEIDEALASEDAPLPEGEVDTIVLANAEPRDVPQEKLAERLARAPWNRAITSLVLSPSSRLHDVTVASAFPRLVNLQVNGLRVKTLEGVERLRELKYLNVDTGSNKSRDIAAIQNAVASKVTVYCARSSDLDALAGNRSMQTLELGGAPSASFATWSDAQLSTMSLSNGSFHDVESTASVPTLQKLALTGCRKLEAFTGDNGNLTWLVIQRCPALRLQTLSTCAGVESLTIMGNRDALTMRSLGPFARLTSLSLLECEVEIGASSVEAAMPRLEKLRVSGMKVDAALRFSRANPKMLISTGTRSYRAGETVAG